MPSTQPTSVRELLLTRQGLVFLEATEAERQAELARAVELEFAQIGYVATTRLSERLAALPLAELDQFRKWAVAALLAHRGGNQKHVPLFRKFPDGVPADTTEFWWQRVLVHFLQADDQPCRFCRREGTTHVLRPCRHVVCDNCFDGANFSACPVCGRQVHESPFFKPSDDAKLPSERVTFRLLDLGDNELEASRALFRSLCHRTQALSPDDREALTLLVKEHAERVPSWLPEAIPLRENIAVVFGTLFDCCEPAEVLVPARRFMTTATDVLRLVAVASGTDGSLLPAAIFKEVEPSQEPVRFWGKVAQLLGAPPPGRRTTRVMVPLEVRRFKVRKLPRAVRRSLLALLDGLPESQLIEDMLRHRSYWVWLGEFLHPGEYGKRYPQAHRAFQVVRGKEPDGSAVARFATWNAQVEAHLGEGNVPGAVALLEERPGDFARRLDHVLRLCTSDADAQPVVASFLVLATKMSTPVLLTLRSHFALRTAPAPVRVFWPKGRVATGASRADHRPTLHASLTEGLVEGLEGELLRRFGSKPAHENCIIDSALQRVIVPFNERTASRSAVSLPRGSMVDVPSDKVVRLFLHWCEPERGDGDTDLDLSVAFYDAAWEYRGVCSYYELTFAGANGAPIAKSAGDLTSAPWPDGSTEFVDLDREKALAEGIRYAVMVINAYAGLPFSQLDRAFAGLMLRDDPTGAHFDPRTVKLRFSLEGERGIYMPLVLDVLENKLHWLDVHGKGRLEMNNVETSRPTIGRLCPELITYFGTGTRPAMYELALLHAAARSSRVAIRGETTRVFERRSGETAAAFFRRLRSGEPGGASFTASDSTLAFLYTGDVELPDASEAYVLFPERTRPTLAGSDLVS